MKLSKIKELHKRSRSKVNSVFKVIPSGLEYNHVSDTAHVFMDDVDTFEDYLELSALFGVALSLSYYVSHDGTLAIGNIFKIKNIYVDVTFFIKDLEGALDKISEGSCVIDTIYKEVASTSIRCTREG